MLMLLFLLYPLQFYYPSLLMPEIWVQLLLSISILAIFKKAWPTLSLCLSGLLLLKPAFVLLLPLAVFLCIYEWRKVWIHALPLLVFLSVSYLNFRQTGWFHYSSMAVENSYEYNLKALMNRVNTPEEINTLQERWSTQLAQKNYADKAAFMQARVQDKIAAHPLTYGLLHLKGCFATLLDPGRYDLIAFFEIRESQGLMGIKNDPGQLLRQSPAVLLYMAFFLGIRIVTALAAIFIFIRHFRHRNIQILTAAIFLFIAITGPVGSARYLFPIAPLLLVMASMGLERLSSKTRNEENTGNQ
jgi:hypothetical protein